MNNPSIGSSFDSYLEEEGIKEEVELGAVKMVLALQLQEAIAAQNLTKSELAARLQTSRAAVNRLLDPSNDAVTLQTLKRAATLLGKHIRLELI